MVRAPRAIVEHAPHSPKRAQRSFLELGQLSFGHVMQPHCPLRDLSEPYLNHAAASSAGPYLNRVQRRAPNSPQRRMGPQRTSNDELVVLCWAVRRRGGAGGDGNDWPGRGGRCGVRARGGDEDAAQPVRCTKMPSPRRAPLPPQASLVRISDDCRPRPRRWLRRRQWRPRLLPPPTALSSVLAGSVATVAS